MLQNRLAKLREERANGEHGFTLIELLVVVVIIGILIAIAIPLYLNYQKGANDKAAQSDLRNAVAVLEQCNSNTPGYPVAGSTAGSFASPVCANQVINLSSGTSTYYTPTTATGASAPTSYVLATTNSGGSGKYYCYNSTKGGQVTSITATSLATATC